MQKRYVFLIFLVLFGILLFILIKSIQDPIVRSPGETNITNLNPDNISSLKHDMVVVNSPYPGEKISSPLSVSGTARGGWFFEGSFPIDITDFEGNIIAQKYATAQDDWMVGRNVEVPFLGSIDFEVPEGVSRGYVIFHKDNPSDKRELDDSFSIPVIF